MNKILIDKTVIMQALEKLEEARETVDREWGCRTLAQIEADNDQWDEVIALRQALKQSL